MDDCHIQLKRGSTFTLVIRLIDENNEAKDITGWTYSSDLKLKAGRETLLSFDINDDQASLGILSLSAQPEDTLQLPPNRSLEFDVKLIDPTGDIHYTETIVVKTVKHITD